MAPAPTIGGTAVKKWQIAVAAAAVAAVGVAALFGGRAWGESAPSNEAAQLQIAAQGPGNANMPGMPGDGSRQPGLPFGSSRAGGNMISGTIIAVDSTSITVQTGDGSTKIVLISGSTTVTKTVDGSLSDLVADENVFVSGTTNSDNSVTANSVVLGSNLDFGAAPGGGAPPSGGAQAPSSEGSSDAATAQ